MPRTPLIRLPVRPIALSIKLVLFLILLGFAARNSDDVSIRYFLGLEWQAPLSLVILIAFAAGLLVGLLACSVSMLRRYRELRAMRRALSQAESDMAGKS
jgi:uncharacterized integral membrane protein